MLNVFSGRRDLTIAVAGRMVSRFGDGVALVALTLRLQGEGVDPYVVAALLAAGVAPQMLLARPVGRLVDSYDSRRVLVAGGIVEVATTIPLIVAHSTVAIVTLVAVLGAAAGLTGAAWTALLPHIAGEENLAQAVSAQSSANVLALVGAPAVGGLLAGAFGPGMAVALDAATFAVVTVAAVLIRTRRVPAAIAAADEPADARGGFALLRNDELLAPLLTGVAVVVLLVGMADVVLVYLVRGTLHAGGAWYGVTEAAWMAGMVIGSVAGGRVTEQSGQQHATVAGMALTCAALAGFAVSPTVEILVVASVVGGIGNGYAGTCLSTLLMTRFPDSARGRVSASSNAILGGAQGASLLVGGVVTVGLSPRELYGLAGLLGLAASIVVAARPVRSRRRYRAVWRGQAG